MGMCACLEQYGSFTGFSVGFCINKRRLFVTNFSSENNLPMFRLNAPFTLMTTGAFSRNVRKLFSKLKLVTNNLLYGSSKSHLFLLRMQFYLRSMDHINFSVR